MKILRFIDVQGKFAFACVHEDGTHELLEGNYPEGFKPTGKPAAIREIHAPIAPSQILCVGLNYRRHAEETKARIPARPVLFMKSPSSYCGPEHPIVLPRFLESKEVDYECELAVVIGRSCKNVCREEALEYVAGYTCANDVSARDHQIRWGGSQWCRGKSFDSFCPLGPWIVTPDEIGNPNALRIETRLNGNLMQSSTTADMIFSVTEIIEYLSAGMTLTPGTVILTGTPEGVGMARNPPVWLQPGDRVEVTIEKIGTLGNPVVAEETGGMRSRWNAETGA
jgi:2-keto-4-pentenoate hydratase/2-oxohepta-3-ene-1,7-dioic acid hydratase in catechol pathway